MILRSDEPSVEERVRTWDPVFEAVATMPLTSPEMAMELVVLGVRLERALLTKQWSEASQVVEDIRNFVAFHSGEVA